MWCSVVCMSVLVCVFVLVLMVFPAEYTGKHVMYIPHCIGTKACGSCEEVSEFLDQATLLRGISHRNVLSVMGLCSDNHQAPIVIYSYPSIGSLHTFLTAHRQATSATRQKGVRKNLSYICSRVHML